MKDLRRFMDLASKILHHSARQNRPCQKFLDIGLMGDNREREEGRRGERRKEEGSEGKEGRRTEFKPTFSLFFKVALSFFHSFD